MILGDLSIKSEKLFVVGDPKQSIYLFRNADVTLFKETQKIIEKGLKGKSVPLDINFRSTSEIIWFVNYLFSRLLSESSKPWEFGYDSIEVSDDRKEDSGSVELLLLPPPAEGQQEYQIEAEMVARRIQNLVEKLSRVVDPYGYDYKSTQVNLKNPI
jgi:ATP-dependent helicase/nuclease subunit A